MDSYWSFLAFAMLLAIAPGPDTILALRASVIGGRKRGLATVAGIGAAGVTQGLLAATGLGAILAHSEPAFAIIRWAGVAYLMWLGLGALRSALRPGHETAWIADESAPAASRRRAVAAFAQGFLCNITNPKVLAFNIAVLPQFIDNNSGSTATLLLYALTLVGVGMVVLLSVVTLGAVAGREFAKPRVRRSVDTGTGVIMLGFATALAVEA